MNPARPPLILAAVLLAAMSACSEDGANRPAPKTAPSEMPGAAADLRDPYTPGDGNGGYDVQNYALNLSITPGAPQELAGTATIMANATQPLTRFNLDLTGLSVSKVTVNGRAASYARSGTELVVTPPSALAQGGRFTVAVTYAGTPKEINDPVLGRYGWVHTHDGVFIGAQPSGAHTWFPSNDHPSDKATFDIKVTVPKGLTAISNGDLVDTADSGNSTTYTWRERDPMATYLATADVGRFEVKKGRTPGGVPVYAAVDPTVKTITLDQLYTTTVQVTDAWTKLFGPYPFRSTGGIVDDAQVQFALENQTKPEYSPDIAAEPTVIAHELAHQWFGDSVSLTKWSDIWLNEGFATYAEWMWGERIGEMSVQRQFDLRYAQPDNKELWSVPPGAPGREQLFGRSVYDRGGMTLHALRKKVGDATFFTILRSWAAEHRHGNATTPQFIALAERVSGRKLDGLFRAWLFEEGRPDM